MDPVPAMTSHDHMQPRVASACLLRSVGLCGLGGSLMDLLDCAEDHRRGALDGPAYQVPGAVAVLYLGKPLLGRHGLAVRAGGHVAASEHAGQYVRCRVELGTQDIGEFAFVGFDDGAGVMCDQPAHQGVGVLGVAQVPGAVELVQARKGKAGRVADVMQPRGGFQQIGVSAENRCQAACPGGDALDVGPAARVGSISVDRRDAGGRLSGHGQLWRRRSHQPGRWCPR
jgi:hypothetical protein